jgi:hypothetical protein
MEFNEQKSDFWVRDEVQKVGLLLIGLIVSSQYPLSRKLLGLIVAFMFSDWLA